ncbi:MAG TPA: tetratricopeptide repeat protein [Blastocatellia bacterium]|nr:tetratricopeptide repeat protein [Blastocatellia bacterium]
MNDNPEQNQLYRFGPFRLDPVRRVLTSEGKPVALTPKAFEILFALIENRGTVVDKSDLIRRVWPDSIVEEINLTVQISTLRKMLGESPDDHRYIVTIPRRGYSFVAQVSTVDETEIPSPETVSRDDAAAPSRSGENQPPIVMTAGGGGQGEQSAEAESSAATLSSRLTRKKKWIVIGAAAVLVLAATAAVILVGTRPKKSPGLSGRTIAVFPFKLLGSEDPNNLEVGMADAVITRLSRLDRLTVRPTNTMFNYAGHSYDPLVAGRELRADAVMQGTIQQSDDQVRVTVQLIDVSEGKPIWADRFDERRANILAAQDSISEQVVDALAVTLAGEDKNAAKNRDTQNPEAVAAYMKGIYFWNKRSDESLRKSIEYFQEAVNKDPSYARAYAGMADAAGLIGLNSMNSATRKEYFEKAREAARTAIGIDETVAEAHVALALVKVQYESDWPGAEKELQRAIELAPNYATAHQRYAWYLFGMGQMDRAAQEMERAANLDPLSVVNHTAWADVLYFRGDYDRAIEQCQKTLELDPNNQTVSYLLGLSYEQKGEYARAIAAMQTADSKARDDVDVIAGLGHVYGMANRKSEGREVVKRLEKLSAANSSAMYGVALVYAGLGETDQAMNWLEKAARAKATTNLRFRYDPRLSDVRRHPRFDSFLKMRSGSNG